MRTAGCDEVSSHAFQNRSSRSFFDYLRLIESNRYKSNGDTKSIEPW